MTTYLNNEVFQNWQTVKNSLNQNMLWIINDLLKLCAPPPFFISGPGHWYAAANYNLYVNCPVNFIIGQTKPIVKMCVDCQHEFLSPMEGTTCKMPDGTLVSYSEPILKCPLCYENQFGTFLNKDFMPELANWSFIHCLFHHSYLASCHSYSSIFYHVFKFHRWMYWNSQQKTIFMSIMSVIL